MNGAVPGYLRIVATLALTFDDGPDSACTRMLLDELENLGATATFFPIAARAAARPDLIRRMLEAGHTVGVHCHQHVRHSERDVDWVRRDLNAALRLLRSVGVFPTLWRTPWGDLAPWSADLAHEQRLRLVGWTVDTHDWRGDAAEEIVARIRPELASGAILLAHDGIGPGARRGDAAETIRLTRLIGDHARRAGLRLEALR
jgi:peptidoglycan/xylan/chitin deacetylase (PgdA/CDA1 family)